MRAGGDSAGADSEAVTWEQRLEAVGVLALVLAGMLSVVAAAVGVVPVAPPQLVAGFLGLLALTKAAATGAGLLSFASSRS